MEAKRQLVWFDLTVQLAKSKCFFTQEGGNDSYWQSENGIKIVSEAIRTRRESNAQKYGAI